MATAKKKMASKKAVKAKAKPVKSKVAKPKANKSASKIVKSKSGKPVAKKAAKSSPKKLKPFKKDILDTVEDDDVELLSQEEIDQELAEYEKQSKSVSKRAKALANESDAMKLSRQMAEFMFEKKGEEVVIADLDGLSSAADCFVICTATSDMHAKAIADNVEDKLRDMGHRIHHKEGHTSMKWILLDYVDVIAHVFQRDAREFYDLERLWGDAKFFKLQDK